MVQIMKTELPYKIPQLHFLDVHTFTVL